MILFFVRGLKMAILQGFQAPFLFGVGYDK